MKSPLFNFARRIYTRNMTRTLLAFGDSNTHGTMPTTAWGQGGRFGPADRWPGVTRTALGTDWTVIEEGLPGRTATALPDPVMGPHMNGQIGLQIALASHVPIDVLVIMLGTNDCKAAFGLTAEGIAGAAAALLAIAKDAEQQEKHNGFKILLIAPPLVREEGIYLDGLWTAASKSRQLPGLYAQLAAHNGIDFLDASLLIQCCAEDGVHFDSSAHRTLGRAVADRVANL